MLVGKPACFRDSWRRSSFRLLDVRSLRPSDATAKLRTVEQCLGSSARPGSVERRTRDASANRQILRRVSNSALPYATGVRVPQPATIFTAVLLAGAVL